jgi:hypothetical protein
MSSHSCSSDGGGGAGESGRWDGSGWLLAAGAFAAAAVVPVEARFADVFVMAFAVLFARAAAVVLAPIIVPSSAVIVLALGFAGVTQLAVQVTLAGEALSTAVSKFANVSTFTNVLTSARLSGWHERTGDARRGGETEAGEGWGGAGCGWFTSHHTLYEPSSAT